MCNVAQCVPLEQPTMHIFPNFINRSTSIKKLIHSYVAEFCLLVEPTLYSRRYTYLLWYSSPTKFNLSRIILIIRLTTVCYPLGSTNLKSLLWEKKHWMFCIIPTRYLGLYRKLLAPFTRTKNDAGFVKQPEVFHCSCQPKKIII